MSDHGFINIDQNYVDSISQKYNVVGYDAIAKAELIELEKSGIIGEFLRMKFKRPNQNTPI